MPVCVGEGAAETPPVGVGDVESLLGSVTFADDGLAEVASVMFADDGLVEVVFVIVPPSPPPRACPLALVSPASAGGSM